MQDHQRIAERMLWRGVHGTDGLVECMFCEVARTVGASADVMKVDGKVERHAEARRMPRRQRAERMFVRSLVRFQRQLPRTLSLLTSRKFREIPIIVALPVKNISVRCRKEEGAKTCILR